MLEPGPCCCAAPHLLRVFTLSWLLLLFFLPSLLLLLVLGSCEVEGVVTIMDNDSTSTSAMIKNTRRSTAAAAAAGEATVDSTNIPASANNSSDVSDWAPNPGIAVSLSLSLDQELSSNPFVNLRPTLSLSLSLSVFGEMKANPFGFVIKLPLPQPAEQQDDGPTNQVQPPDHEQEQLLKQGASLLQPQVKGSSWIRWGKCSYTVTIKTSCSSPRVTRDAVSLAFGDASRNEVYAARLDDPASGTFERCSIDTFRVVGPCGGRTCYLYLRRSGRDGWTPEYVKVFYSPGDPRAAVTFFYKVPLPDGVWYGFNLCHGGVATTPSTSLNALGKERDDIMDGDHQTTATATATATATPA